MILAWHLNLNKVEPYHLAEIHNYLSDKFVNIGLIFMLHAMAFVTFSLNKIVESLFRSLMTDRINHASQEQ